MLDAAPQTVVVKNNALTVAEFADKPLSGIQILKTSADGKTPLAGAVFTIDRPNGERITTGVTNGSGKYATDVSGKIVVHGLESGVYIISEVQPPTGYLLDATPQTVEVKSGKLTLVEFVNSELPSLYIRKIDSVTGALVAGARFVVTTQSGAVIAEVVSLSTGAVVIPSIQPGFYTITETQPPEGYELNSPAQNVEVRADGSVYYNGAALVGNAATFSGNTATFANSKLNSLEILKLDSVTHKPLSGAAFEVTKANGEKIGSYRTDASGKILIPDISAGTYAISETAAPQGYVLDSTPQNVNVNGGKLVTVEFVNKPLSGIVVLKTDAYSHAPLMGATFEVTRDMGEKVGTFKTDAAGKFIAAGLSEGTYIISETIAPDNYILDASPQTVIVKSGKLTEAEFVNKPLAGLKIVKLDSVTRQPIEGAEFNIFTIDGARVENDFRGYTFRTDRTGAAFANRLADGYYSVVEVKAADGYILDAEPQTVHVKSGKMSVVEVLNTPYSGLLIIKTDEATRKPLSGVKFEVKKPTGEQIGVFTTDISGQIRLSDVPTGKLIVVETAALDGYEIDTQAREVTIYAGKQTTLEVTNRQKSGLRLIKIDSVTKRGIYGVEFTVFDAGGKVVGMFYTDDKGVIDFAGLLTEGRYTIRETRPAPNYYPDDIPRTVSFKSGEYTEVRWENVAKAGQIQILKKSADDNEVNGLSANSPLANAVFEVYEYKSCNLVDRFVSGTDGRAVSKPLPLGRYTVREVQAPQYYKLSDKTLDVELEFGGQILKFEYVNYSANTGVYIKKVGNVECMPGDTIRYDFKAIQNTGTVPLTDFYSILIIY